MIWTILVILAVVGLDQWTKVLALAHLRQVKTLPLIENILHLTYVENRGAAFGMLGLHGVLHPRHCRYFRVAVA